MIKIISHAISAACLLSTTALISTSVLASDLPSRQSAPSPAVSNQQISVSPSSSVWDGFYVGAHAGYDFMNVRGQEVGTYPTFQSYAIDPHGFAGGVHAGYNMTFMNSYLVGLEGDIDYIGPKGSQAVVPGTTFEVDVGFSNRYRRSLIGRLGYIINDFLVYGLGGGAYNINKIDYAGVTHTNSFKTGQLGWTLGAGAEYALTQNWLARVEYRYSDFGTVNQDVATGAFTASAQGNHVEVKQHDQLVSLGISYKFDSNAPLRARY
jgi:outer membrane immunogenic protein